MRSIFKIFLEFSLSAPKLFKNIIIMSLKIYLYLIEIVNQGSWLTQIKAQMRSFLWNVHYFELYSYANAINLIGTSKWIF